MKRFLVSLFILTCHVPAYGSGTIEDFIRGTSLTFWAFGLDDTVYFHCIPGMTERDPNQMDWDNELDLLSEMHANFPDLTL